MTSIGSLCVNKKQCRHQSKQPLRQKHWRSNIRISKAKEKYSFYVNYLGNYVSALNYLCNYVSTGIYLFKVNNRNTRARWEMCSTLTIKTLKLRQWCRSGFLIVNFEHISHLVLVFLLLTLKMKLLVGVLIIFFTSLMWLLRFQSQIVKSFTLYS